jgi:hypothetical protein
MSEHSTIQRNQRYLDRLLAEVDACEVCDWKDKDVLDYHPSAKQLYNHAYSRARIDKEIAEKQILCGNCTRRAIKGLLLYSNSTEKFYGGTEIPHSSVASSTLKVQSESTYGRNNAALYSEDNIPESYYGS